MDEGVFVANTTLQSSKLYKSQSFSFKTIHKVQRDSRGTDFFA